MPFYEPERVQYRSVVRGNWERTWDRLTGWLKNFKPQVETRVIKLRPPSHAALVAKQRKARGRYGRHA